MIGLEFCIIIIIIILLFFCRLFYNLRGGSNKRSA